MYELLKYPNANGILEFVLGLLFTLTIYHLFLFVQNRDKAYLYYALYTFLTVFGYVNLARNNFIADLISPVKFLLDRFDVYSKFLYNAMYFVFAFEFIGLLKKSKSWYLRVMIPLFIIVIIGTISQLISLITWNNNYIFQTFHIFFVPTIFIPTILGYYVLFKYQFSGKYYLIVGSLFLFITSMAGVVLHHILGDDGDNEIRFSIFYLGLIVENVCFSLGLGYRYKKELERRSKKEQNYLQQLINSQEEEREKIAKELHDGVVQHLGSVVLKMKQKSCDKDDWVTITSELESVNAEIRNVSHQMMPHSLEQFGLVASLKWVFESAFGAADIKYYYDTIGVDQFIPKEISLNLYRIAQELTSNIIKHSKCNEVEIQMIQKEGTLIFIMEDDGIGIKRKKNTVGIGLENIETRIRYLNGSYSFENGVISGTITTIKIPLT